jgi:hypothetical protein
MAVVEKEMS